jgi:hypothetical protein
MRRNIFPILTSLLIGLILSTQAFSLVLYDDFSGTSINKDKWKQTEFVREIDSGSNRLLFKLASPNPATVPSFPYITTNGLPFSNPDLISSIQTDVTILEDTKITGNCQAEAKVGGRWYNDGAGTPGSDATGDIWAEVTLIQDSTDLHARWTVVRYTNPAGTTSKVLGIGNFTTPIAPENVYTLLISYDSAVKQFRFRVGTEEFTFGPTGLPLPMRDPNVPLKFLATRVQIADANSSGYISAAFDNVVARDQYDNIVVSDDFSLPIIDATKWTNYEFVREISNGKLRSKVRSSAASADYIFNLLEFTDPSSINAIQAVVTPVTYENDHKSNIAAYIAGRFYNDGTSGGGLVGDVGAEVLIGGAGSSPTAGWVVWKETDDDPNNLPKYLASGIFDIEIKPNNTYTLFLEWDGSKFTFKCEDKEAYYTPAPDIHPANSPWKAIGSRFRGSSGEEATSEALFDDVQINGSGVMGDVSLDRQYYTLSDAAVVTLRDPDLNIDPESSQTVNVRIISTSDATGISLTLKETDVDSGIFTSTSFGKDLRFTSGSSDDVNQLIRVADGDTISVIYNDVSPQQMGTATAVIDATPPETTPIPSRSLYYDGKNYIAPISITYALSATDVLSGVKRIEYNIDGSPFAEYTKPFTLGSAGSHTIRYKALDKAGNWEGAKSAVIIVDNTPPSAPKDLVGSLDALNVGLYWTANSEADLAGYNVYRDGRRINSQIITGINYYEQSVAAGKTYVFNVTSVDRVGNESLFSNSVSITTLSTAPVIIRPLSGAQVLDFEIYVLGTAEPGSTVELFVNGDSRGTAITSSSRTFNLSAVKISEGRNDLKAISTNSNGVVSPESSTVTVFLDPRPQPPAGLTATAGDTVVTLTWTPNPETDILHYDIYRDGFRLSRWQAEATFKDMRLTNGRPYTYTIIAIDSRGIESNKTSTITVTPVAGPEWGSP